MGHVIVEGHTAVVWFSSVGNVGEHEPGNLEHIISHVDRAPSRVSLYSLSIYSRATIMNCNRKPYTGVHK